MGDQVDRLLKLREKDYPDNLLKARELLLKAPGETDYTRLSEVLFWLGEYAADPEDQEEFYGEGVEHGRAAAAVHPDSVAANLWLGANMGAHGLVKGIMSSLSYLPEIEKYGNRALELDENYFHAAPLRLMGRFYHKAPGFPLGPGNLRKAIQLLEEAVEKGPDFYLNHLYLAEAYLSRRRKDQARELLEEILEAPPPKDLPDYHAIVQAEAQELLEKL